VGRGGIEELIEEVIDSRNTDSQQNRSDDEENDEPDECLQVIPTHCCVFRS
jgi:hypothetical protein